MALVDRTEVHNMDFAEVIALAQPNWALYCDPPYFEIGDTLYNISWTEDDHIRLRNALLFNPARWVLSYGDHPRIHDLYQHADIAVLEAHHGMKKRKSNELIITPRIS